MTKLRLLVSEYENKCRVIVIHIPYTRKTKVISFFTGSFVMYNITLKIRVQSKRIKQEECLTKFGAVLSIRLGHGSKCMYIG